MGILLGGCASHNEIVAKAQVGLAALCEEYAIDESHGVLHANAVLMHAEGALREAEPLLTSVDRVLAVRLAALLHDADDHKYFGKASSKVMANAARIMTEAGASDAVVEEAKEMISLVSCSANGNSCPPRARELPELLWPRWADRLEAAGEIGVARCYLHNQKDGAPIAVAGTTPRCTTDEEAFALATEERFSAYQERGGSSASMIDHYFDKLLQVARPAPELVRNPYLEREATNRVAPLLSVIKAYGATGEAPISQIDAIVEACGLGKKKRKAPADDGEQENAHPTAGGSACGSVLGIGKAQKAAHAL